MNDFITLFACLYFLFLKSEFESILNRMMLNVILISDEFFSYLKNNDFDSMHNLRPVFKSVDKLSIFCKRMITLKGTHDPRRSSHSLYSIINLFKTISYSYERLVNYTADENIVFFDSRIIN